MNNNRKEWTTPRITEYGNVEELTAEGFDDFWDDIFDDPPPFDPPGDDFFHCS
jgi:hypothetical protein